ncbi:MAG: helix-turn-helix domain-containing protein [Eubacteriales bacterium]|nr:helix-turn-helix domain-containing protein [Eubacteriales bacterium]MDD3880716.1 helix-turn-helix domain-containing protein [Eubacteriales bacterium]MDD4511650.1 helix-turn-helix domain-containing protein [Eubacteriales bacterium]
MLYDSIMTTEFEQALGRLSMPVFILDRNGMCLYPTGGGQFVLPDMPLGTAKPVPMYGNVFLPLSADANVILMAQQADGTAGDVLLMVDSMMTNILSSTSPILDETGVYRRAIKEEVSGADLELLAQEHHIDLEMQRCVILFQATQPRAESTITVLSNLVPCADGDTLVELDRHTVVLLKDMTQMDEPDDLEEYTGAVVETVLTEAGLSLTVGIGETRQTLSALGESYREAQRAIDVGKVFRPDEHIFIFRKLMLERLLMEIPQDTAQHYHALLFNRKTARLINEEMLFTIEMFFRKDLNLSDTARQLYIHRNTLVYRLDKVQRLIGLDLRKFEDAVTFKILYELKKCITDRQSTVR